MVVETVDTFKQDMRQCVVVENVCVTIPLIETIKRNTNGMIDMDEENKIIIISKYGEVDEEELTIDIMNKEQAIGEFTGKNHEDCEDHDNCMFSSRDSIIEQDLIGLNDNWQQIISDSIINKKLLFNDKMIIIEGRIVTREEWLDRNKNG